MSITSFTDAGKPVVITVKQQEGTISNTFSSSMLYNFLMGAYTVVYFGTVYLYLTKKGQNIQRRIVISTITLLYSLCVTNFALQWYSLKTAIVDNGDTRKSIFIASLVGPSQRFGITVVLVQYFMVIISDGLLLWRCFHLWNKSWRVIAFPLFLTIAELILIIPLSILWIRQSAFFDHLASVFLFISAGSTFISAALIGYKVYGASSGLTEKKSRRRFAHIFRVLLESAALYALINLFNAVINIVPAINVPYSVVTFISFYSEPLVPISAGMAPTVLVARIITSQSEAADLVSITHISGLQFQSQQVAQTRNMSQLTKSENAANLEYGVVELGGIQERDDGLVTPDEEKK